MQVIKKLCLQKHNMCMTKMPTQNSSAIMLSIEPTIVCLRVWALPLKANNLFSNAPIATHY